MDASDKQGYLGDLSNKTTTELNELLRRQEKILQNVKFIDKLCDKGQRIKNFVEKVNAELAARMDVDATADLFHQMALTAERANRERGKAVAESDDEDNANQDPLKEIVNRAMDEKKITDNRENKEIVNSYEKVIKKSEKKLSPKKKFYPHKTVKTEHVDDISSGLDKMKFSVTKDIVSLDSPASLESPVTFSKNEDKDKNLMNKDKEISSDSAGHTCDIKSNINVQCSHTIEKTVGKTTLGLKSECPKLKHRYDENLEMSPYEPSKKFEGAKLISIEESIGILECQKKKQEMLQAKIAGDRLAQRLGIKMVDFEPKFQEMRYRSHKDSDADSTDTDGEEVDYPD